VRAERHNSPREVVDAIFAAVHDFRGDTPPNDDMTAVALKITT
jgi:serine phosphatase RsbU (regulator of sigma subunit)